MMQNSLDKTDLFLSSFAVLGATGSVGRQALEVAQAQGLSLDFLTAHRNVSLAEEQIRRFSPISYVMTDPEAAKDLSLRVKDTKTKVYGADALQEIISSSAAQNVIHAILGEAGLQPLLYLIDAKKRIGLANKESLVIGGDIIMRHATENKVDIIPVDSEHSAIFQCLNGAPKESVRSLLLTASGGPFFSYTKEQLQKVTKAQTLAHPTWNMGAKITVDSATLMNKGFEVIEAVRLFGVTPDQIQVVVHRESIIHSAVEYIDSAFIAQMGVPDMRLCIQYALTYPKRAKGLTRPLSLAEVGKLTFAAPDTDTFPLLPLAFRAITLGGGVPAVLNAANEVAVSAFLSEKLSFTGIFDVVCETVNALEAAKHSETLQARIADDRKARQYATDLLNKY